MRSEARLRGRGWSARGGVRTNRTDGPGAQRSVERTIELSASHAARGRRGFDSYARPEARMTDSCFVMEASRSGIVESYPELW